MKRKSFTLIELLIVVAIMAILLATVLLAIGETKARARDAKRINDAQNILKVAEMYKMDHNTYYIRDKDGNPTGYSYPAGQYYSNGWVNLDNSQTTSFPVDAPGYAGVSIMNALASRGYIVAAKDPLYDSSKLGDANDHPYDYMYYQNSETGIVGETPGPNAHINIFMHLERPKKIINGYDERSTTCYSSAVCDQWTLNYKMNYRIGN